MTWVLNHNFYSTVQASCALLALLTHAFLMATYIHPTCLWLLSENPRCSGNTADDPKAGFRVDTHNPHPSPSD